MEWQWRGLLKSLDAEGALEGVSKMNGQKQCPAEGSRMREVVGEA